MKSIVNETGLPLLAKTVLLVGASAFIGNLLNQAQNSLEKVRFEEGGLIGGRRHSQGGTIIEAERGEFVMNRNAVDAVGIEGMEAINEGGGIGTTVNINNPIISSEFVEEELPELIAEAIRKGANFGMS